VVGSPPRRVGLVRPGVERGGRGPYLVRRGCLTSVWWPAGWSLR